MRRLIVVLAFASMAFGADVDCSKKCWVVSYKLNEPGGYGGWTYAVSNSVASVPMHEVQHVDTFSTKAEASKFIASLGGYTFIDGSVRVFEASEERITTKVTEHRVPQPDLIQTEKKYCIQMADCDKQPSAAISVLGTGAISTDSLVFFSDGTASWKSAAVPNKAKSGKH